MLTRKVKVQ